MSGENWTPKVGDRVRVKKGIAWMGTVYVVGAVYNGQAEGRECGTTWSTPCCFSIENIEPADIDQPRPIAYVKQTRPDVDFDLRTPYQQRGWAP